MLALSTSIAGELFRIILSPPGLIGVCELAAFELEDRLSLCASFVCSFFGDEESIGPSARRAWVTLENLIAGGGSSSESLSPISIRCVPKSSVRMPCDPCSAVMGELRRTYGLVGCATTAMIRLTLLPSLRTFPSLLATVSVSWLYLPFLPSCVNEGLSNRGCCSSFEVCPRNCRLLSP